MGVPNSMFLTEMHGLADPDPIENRKSVTLGGRFADR